MSVLFSVSWCLAHRGAQCRLVNKEANESQDRGCTPESTAWTGCIASKVNPRLRVWLVGKSGNETGFGRRMVNLIRVIYCGRKVTWNCVRCCTQETGVHRVYFGVLFRTDH